jgi:hypothetical protein
MANHEEHEEHQGHEHDNRPTKRDDRHIEQAMASPWLHMRVPSPLPPETESVMTETIGCAIAVHRARSGFSRANLSTSDVHRT